MPNKSIREVALKNKLKPPRDSLTPRQKMAIKMKAEKDFRSAKAAADWNTTRKKYKKG